MKSRGLMAIACAAALSAACTGEVREDSRPVNETEQFEADDREGTTGELDTAGTTGTGVSADARSFVEKAAHGGMAEVQLGQLAGERAQNAEVKQFGEMMVRDHSKASDELKQAVSRYNVQMPTSLDEKHSELMDRLRNLRGAEFDREYMAAMVDGHQEMQGLLEDRVDQGREDQDNRNQADNAQGLNTALNQWAMKAKPTVDQHLKTAQQIQEKLGNSRNSTN